MSINQTIQNQKIEDNLERRVYYMLFKSISNIFAKRQIRKIEKLAEKGHNIRYSFEDVISHDLNFLLKKEVYSCYILKNSYYYFGFGLLVFLIIGGIYYKFITLSVLAVLFTLIGILFSILVGTLIYDLGSNLLYKIDAFITNFRYSKLRRNLKRISKMDIKQNDSIVSQILKLSYLENTKDVKDIFFSDEFKKLNKKYGNSNETGSLKITIFNTVSQSLDYQLISAQFLKKNEIEIAKLKQIMNLAERHLNLIDEETFEKTFVSFYKNFSNHINEGEMQEREQKKIAIKSLVELQTP